jgi:hypothetical protein
VIVDRRKTRRGAAEKGAVPIIDGLTGRMTGSVEPAEKPREAKGSERESWQITEFELVRIIAA